MLHWLCDGNIQWNTLEICYCIISNTDNNPLKFGISCDLENTITNYHIKNKSGMVIRQSRTVSQELAIENWRFQDCLMHATLTMNHLLYIRLELQLFKMPHFLKNIQIHIAWIYVKCHLILSMQHVLVS